PLDYCDLHPFPTRRSSDLSCGDRSTAHTWRTSRRITGWNGLKTSLYWHLTPNPAPGGFLRFVPFELERWQSTWENRVRYNLSESGVHPLSIHELLELAGASPAPLLDVRLGYSQS